MYHNSNPLTAAEHHRPPINLKATPLVWFSVDTKG